MKGILMVLSKFMKLIEAVRNKDNEILRDFSQIPSVTSGNPPVLLSANKKLSPNQFLLSQRDVAPPLPGISLVAACMNREENLLKVIDSWLTTDVNEIVIVDWSSTSELRPKLSRINDPRLKLIRIDGEQYWVLTHALNVGLRFASHELVYKVDCDIELTQDFFKKNTPQNGEFVRGFWKSGLEHGGEGQQFINGTFGAYKEDLRKANYYDERIMSYGWDDSDIYLRLTHDHGLAAKLIDPATLRHLEQEQEQRIGNQKVSRNRFLGKYEPTEFEGAKNKYYSFIAGNWATYFPSQDYEYSLVEQQYYRGCRVTEPLGRRADYDYLAEVLAAKQLTVWAWPSALPDVESLQLAKVVRDAHAINKSHALVERIADGSGIYFIRCGSSQCREAIQKTLSMLCSHFPRFAQSLVLVESSSETATDVSAPADESNMIAVPGTLLDKMITMANATAVDGIGELETLAESGDSAAHCLMVSTRALALEAISKASHFSDKLGEAYEQLPAPLPVSCMVTSLYDELNLVRLIEYIACVVENLKVFERIAIYYEAGNGLLAAVLHEISEELAIPPGRLLLIPYQKRPTFEELFSVQTLFPAGTTIAVANADIVFDASFSKIERVDLSKNIVVLSRRDISQQGTKAGLIHLENDIPNTFSSDAWITTTPVKADFFLDYFIGTMHCDSFINYQVSTSSHYGIINPCLDISIFHLHDERFNSSTEKAKREAEVMKINYSRECERNGGKDPLRGVAWSTITNAAIVPGAINMQRWIGKGAILHLGKCSEVTFGHLLAVHILCYIAKASNENAVVIRLRRKDLDGPVGLLFARYQAHFSLSNFQLDLEEDFESPIVNPETTVVRTITFETLAGWIVDGTLESLGQNITELLAWPTQKFLRCDVLGNMTTEATLTLYRAMQQRASQAIESLHQFFNGLQDYSAEKNLITPFIVPQTGIAPAGKANPTRHPTVSFVTSLYNGGAFLPGYLENVFCAAREAGGEVIIVDANADDHDSRIVNEFLDKYPSARNIIDFVRLDRDPGLYECWKIGIKRAKADLITNANLDDRRCPQHTARLVRQLSEHPEYAGACGSISCVRSGGEGGWFTLEENELWFYYEPIKAIGFDDLYRRNESGEVMSRNVMHCMPVWRKSLHERYGYFDEEKYGTSADWAFWLKCAKAGEKFVFDKTAFGRYYLNPESHNRRNDANGIKERRIIKDFLEINQSTILKQ